MVDEKVKKENHPKLGMNLYQQKFCCFCHKLIKIGEFIVSMSKDNSSCTDCSKKITEDWFKKKGRKDG